MSKIIEKNLAVIIVLIVFALAFSSCASSSCAFKNSNTFKTYNVCPAYH